MREKLPLYSLCFKSFGRDASGHTLRNPQKIIEICNPEFDPKQAIDPHQLWSFTFNKAGSWRYHDHLFPEMKGVIIVE